MIVFFDTETDDLISNSARALKKQPMINEIFALKTDEHGNEIGAMSTLVEWRRTIPEEAVRITGITDDMLKADGRPVRKVMEEFSAFCEGCSEVVAHNLSFDMSAVQIEMSRLALGPFPWPPVKTCTVEATEHMKGFRLNLSGLHEMLFGEAFSGAHRAEVDVRAMAKCYFELRNRGEL